jgi:hypothetical protein
VINKNAIHQSLREMAKMVLLRIYKVCIRKEGLNVNSGLTYKVRRKPPNNQSQRKWKEGDNKY